MIILFFIITDSDKILHVVLLKVYLEKMDCNTKYRTKTKTPNNFIKRLTQFYSIEGSIKLNCKIRAWRQYQIIAKNLDLAISVQSAKISRTCNNSDLH